MEVEEHYSMLLGLNSPWEISHVDLKLDEQQVDIEYLSDQGPLTPMP